MTNEQQQRGSIDQATSRSGFAIQITERPKGIYSGKFLQEADNLRLLLRDIHERPLLTPEQERALGERAQEGDRQAIDELVERNLRLVINVALQFMGGGVELLDLIQEGTLGLWRAAQLFNPDQGRFSTYAVNWIRQRIGRAIQNYARPVRIPVYADQQLGKIRRSRENAAQRGDLAPTREQLAALTGMEATRIAELEHADAKVASLDALVAGEDEDLLVTLPDETEHTEDAALTALFQQEVQQEMRALLTKREHYVITQRWFFGLSLSQTGQCMGGLSHEGVRQIEIRALKKLRASKRVQQLYAAYR